MVTDKSIGTPIQDLIKLLIGMNPGDIAPSGIVCTVKEVDEANALCTCTPIDDSPDYLNVRLQPEPGTGILFIPAVGSKVTIGLLNKNVAYVTQYSTLDGIKALDGSFGGLVKVIELTDKLNNLENKVNDLIAACKSQVVTLAPSGTFPLASFFSSVNNLVPTQQNEIENDKITHGE